MFDSALIDIAIGLTLVFLLFSLLVTAASEMCASAFKWRAAHLWDGIGKLLQSDSQRNELYKHPLIKGLSGALPMTRNPDFASGRKGPSYIPSRTFAMALLDTLREPHEALDRLMRRIDALTVRLAADPKAALTEIGTALSEALAHTETAAPMKTHLESLQRAWFNNLDQHVVAPIVEGVRAVLTDVPDAKARTDLEQWITRAGAATGVELRGELERIVTRIAPGSAEHRARTLLAEIATEIPNSDPQALRKTLEHLSATLTSAIVSGAGGELQRSLRTLLSDAATDADRFRENIEVWFNDGMDRVSGQYKRHTMKWQFGIAAVLAIALNVDTLLLARALWREPTLRKALASEGARVAEAAPASLVRPATTVRSSGTTPEITVTLSAPSVQAGEDQTAYVSVAGAPAEAVTVNVEARSAHLTLRAAKSGPAREKETITIPAGQAGSVPVYIVADAVRTESLERIALTAGASTVTAEILARPAADQRYDNLQKQLSGLGLPIGWSCGSGQTLPFWCAGSGAGALGGGGRWRFLDVLALLLGWLITAAAASFGAPFWFDTLKRVVAIRSAGKAPEERPLSPKQVPQPREPGQRPVEADLLRVVSR